MREDFLSGPVALEGSRCLQLLPQYTTGLCCICWGQMGWNQNPLVSVEELGLLKHTEKKSFSISALTISATRSLCFNVGRELSNLLIDLSVRQNFFESFIFEESLLKNEALGLRSCLVVRLHNRLYL